jgi:hypothetical protein
MRLFWVVVALAVGLPGTSSADEKPYAPLATDIARVDSGGTWKFGNQRGKYRAVVRRGCSPEHCYDDLFVEWIEVVAGGGSKVVATKQIPEIPGVTHVSDLRFLFPKKGTQLEVQHEGDGGVDKWTLCFDLGLPGNYASKKGKCARAGS